MVLKEDIHRFISTTELFLSDIRGLRNTGLKKVNFFVGHLVYLKKLNLNLEKLYVFNFTGQFDACPMMMAVNTLPGSGTTWKKNFIFNRQ